jgi:PAS domain S-box-containing protein
VAGSDDELTQTHQALDAERVRFRTLFDLAPIARLATDADGIIREANNAAVRLFERTYERLVGVPLVGLVTSSDRPAVLRMLETAGPHSDTELVVTLSQPRDPPPRVALLGVAPRPSPGAPRSLQWIARDVTADEAAKAALDRALANERATTEGLRTLAELRSIFLTAIAHDLRSPLAALLRTVDVLREHDDLDTERRDELLDGIRRTATEMSTLVVDLLDITRSEHGVMPLDRQDGDLSATVRRAAEQAIAAGTGAGATAGPQVELDLRPVTAHVDHRLVERIVANLVANAQQHVPADGHVWLRLHRRPDGVLLVVEDDGPGIPDAAKPHAFDLFQRGSTSTSLGVGLELVRRFARLHGGWAKVEDRPGGGAVFHVLIPDDPAHPGIPEVGG